MLVAALRFAVGTLCLLGLQRPTAATDGNDLLCPTQSWPQRASAAQQACCPQGRGDGNHRRQLQQTADADCQLPSSCPSAACAAEVIPFIEQCRGLIQAASSQDGGQSSVSYSQLFSSCTSLYPQYAGRPGGNTGSAVAVVGANTDPLTCSFEIVCDQRSADGMSPSGCRTICRGAPGGHNLPPGANCDRLLPSRRRQALQAAIRANHVLLFSTQEDRGGHGANSRLYDNNVCSTVLLLDPATDAYLACVHPGEMLFGQPSHSYIFTGGQYMGSGMSLLGQPPDEFDARMRHSGVALECGASLEPPPPPVGEVEACYKPGSTSVVLHDASARLPQCSRQKAQLPASCSAHGDAAAWNAYVGCAFEANDWAKYRSGGNGGCSGPTTFAFCEAAFPGDPERIKCCSNSRCAWSASLFGNDGGHPACITPEWAVNICCMPCTCWLSPANNADVGGNANMTIVESGYEGRDYPVLVNSDGEHKHHRNSFIFHS